MSTVNYNLKSKGVRLGLFQVKGLRVKLFKIPLKHAETLNQLLCSLRVMLL